MKQLLIVNSGKAINATGATPKDLSVLQPGAITFWELGTTNALAAAPTKNFAIALGRENAPALVIPEVDINTLEVTVAEPSAGNVFSATVVCPTAVVGDDYTIVLVKKNTVFNERNTWTTTIRATTTIAATLATALAKEINDKMSVAGIGITASASAATITITGTEVGDAWTVKTADSLFSVKPTITEAKPNIGDTAYIKDLASRCAAGKGFNLLADEGKEIYPGYPETVETIAQADIATKGYVVFNLHFATKRASGKQLNEPVWQYVHIAVPKNNTSLAAIKTILGQPVLVNDSSN